MKFPLPRPVFPHAEISSRDEQAVISLVDVFVQTLLQQEQEFMVDKDGQVDQAQWKRMRQSENIIAYQERTVDTKSASASASASASDSEHVRTIRPLLIVGKTPGSLDDLLYGSTTPSRESAIIKSSYTDSSTVDVEVLHQLKRPSLSDPFSHLSIKWAVVAPHAKIVRPRDFTFIDAIGTRNLPDGERIGYQIVHSIDVKGATDAAAPGIIRANTSVCFIFRQGTNNHVHVYGRSFCAPGGDIPLSVSTTLATAHLTSIPKQVMSGQAKKLALALRRTDQRAWTVAVPLPKSMDSHACGFCKKKLHLLNKSRSKCALCCRRLCHSCCVRKLLSFLKNDDLSVTRLRITFCSFCVQQAVSLPSAFAASEEFLCGQEDFYGVPVAYQAPSVTSAVA